MSVSTDLIADTVVVGAGIIGIAIARELAMEGREVIVIEQETRHGLHQSSRNSGVIHAGFYYAEHSLKARLCGDAKLALYRYAEDHGVPHRRIGKIVLAADERQLPKLEVMARTAENCGIGDVRLLDAAEVARIEPEVTCVGGLWSPSTGIIDVSALLLSLRGEAENHGVSFALASRVERGRLTPRGWQLDVTSGGEASVVECGLLVNSAGIEAPAFARKLEGYPTERIPASYFAKGSFFTCAGGTPFKHLVYPLPGPIGLGVHLTIGMDGQSRFGPDVEVVDTIDYGLDPSRAASFEAQIRSFWPSLPPDCLMPDYTGIRAKIGHPGDPQDWIIEGPVEHGARGLVNLFGIETPGMTASMAIAREVAARICEGDPA